MSISPQLRWTLPVAVLCVLIATIAAPGSASASNWTLRQLPPTALEAGGADRAGLSGVSCPSESLCVAVGAFNTVAYSESPTGGVDRWQVAHPSYDEPNQGCLERGEPESFCSSPRGSLNAVSCASASLCVAVGYEGSVYTSTDPTGGVWSLGDVNEAHAGATHLTGVSCPTPSLCVAVSGGSNNSNGGRVLTSTDPAFGNWKVTEIDDSLDFRSVSCGTPSLCVAVARGGRLFFSTDPTEGASAWRDAGTPGGPGDLEGASCVSTALCAVGNQTGNVLTSTDPAGGGSTWGEANAGGSVQITGISCTASGGCVAVDNNGDVLTSTDPTGRSGSWHFENLLPFEKEGQVPNALFSASCASPSLCVLVGVKAQIFTSTNPFSVATEPSGSPQRKIARRPRTVLLWAEHFWKFSASRHRRLRARFRFYSPTKVKGFECKRDRRPYRPCRSPLRYWVGHGRHALRVRAIGPTGLRGPAAIKRFRVLKSRRALGTSSSREPTATASGGGRTPRGVLDPTFGAGGRAFGTLPPALASSRFSSLMLQPDGKLLLSGVLLSGEEPVIERREIDGRLDPSFGEGGNAKVSVGSVPFGGGQEANLGLQSNGGIVYAEGGSCTPNTILKRLQSDGSADAGFGTGGATGLQFSFAGLAVDGQDRILVLGLTGLSGSCLPKPGPPQEAKLARLLPDGSLDPSFGTDGVVSLEAEGGPLNQALSFTPREDGSIVVLGGTQRGRLLIGLTASGEPDPAFGGSGSVAVDQESASVLALSGGRLLTANHGGCCGSSSQEIVLGRYLADGESDSSFGESGMAHVSPLPGSEVEALAPGQDGAIVLAGHAKSGGQCAFGVCEGTPFLARLTNAGALDPSFSGNGWQPLDIRSGKRDFPPRVPALAVAPSGELYAAGETGEGEIGGEGNAFVLAREADGSPALAFGSGGLVEETGTLPANTETKEAVLEPDGETVTSAFTNSGSREARPVLIYFRPSGSLNKSRGSGSGFVTVGPMSTIAAAGQGAVYSTRKAGVVRLDSNGRPDPRFGHRGVARLPRGFNAAALLPRRGRLLIAGIAGGRRMGVYQLGKGGEPDRAFGRDGLVVVPRKATEGASALTVDRSGRILLLGAAARNSAQVVRLLADGRVDRSFASNGTRLRLPHYLLNDSSLAPLSGGDLLIAGDSTATGTIHGLRTSVIHLDSRGNLVRSFGKKGVLRIPGFASPIRIFAFKRRFVLATAAPSIGSGGLAVRAFKNNGAVDRTFGRNGLVRVGSTPTLHFGPRFAGLQRDGRILVVGSATHRYANAEPELLRFR